MLKDSMFPEPVAKIWKAVQHGHDTYKRDLSEHEISSLIPQLNRSMSEATREAYSELLRNVEELPQCGEDVADSVIRHAWKQELGRELVNQSIRLIDNQEFDQSHFQALVDQIKSGYLPDNKSVEYVTNDVEQLLEQFNSADRWEFNIPNLQRSTNGIGPGEFAAIFARPEIGKDAFFISCAASPGGWCEQGAKVHILANEERPTRTMLRAVSSYTGMTIDQIKENPKKANQEFSIIANNLVMVDCIGWSITQVSDYCAKTTPDIVVVNQLDKIKDNTYADAPSHERLRSIYMNSREIAKIHNLALFGVSQAGYEAEGKSRIDYSMFEGSRTGKAAELDLIIGIGSNGVLDSLDGANNLRTLNLAKNKLTGMHNSITCKIVPSISRYIQ